MLTGPRISKMYLKQNAIDKNHLERRFSIRKPVICPVLWSLQPSLFLTSSLVSMTASNVSNNESIMYTRHIHCVVATHLSLQALLPQ